MTTITMLMRIVMSVMLMRFILVVGMSQSFMNRKFYTFNILPTLPVKMHVITTQLNLA
ncbi:hypothetical protein D3C84_1274080 [compost metagenome]